MPNKHLLRSRLVQDGQRRVNYYIKPPGPRTSPIYVDFFRSFPMFISIYILNIGAYRVQSRKTDRCIHMHAYHVMLLTHLQIFYPTFHNLANVLLVSCLKYQHSPNLQGIWYKTWRVASAPPSSGWHITRTGYV